MYARLQGHTRDSDRAPIFRELPIQGVCETGEGIWERKPTKSLQCRLCNIIYVNESIPEDLGKHVRRSSSPTVSYFWGVGGESLRVHLS